MCVNVYVTVWSNHWRVLLAFRNHLSVLYNIRQCKENNQKLIEANFRATSVHVVAMGEHGSSRQLKVRILLVAVTPGHKYCQQLNEHKIKTLNHRQFKDKNINQKNRILSTKKFRASQITKASTVPWPKKKKSTRCMWVDCVCVRVIWLSQVVYLCHVSSIHPAGLAIHAIIERHRNGRADLSGCGSGMSDRRRQTADERQ